MAAKWVNLEASFVRYASAENEHTTRRRKMESLAITILINQNYWCLRYSYGLTRIMIKTIEKLKIKLLLDKKKDQRLNFWLYMNLYQLIFHINFICSGIMIFCHKLMLILIGFNKMIILKYDDSRGYR